MLYDEGDRQRVRKALIAATALAWIVLIWTATRQAPHGHAAHVHGSPTATYFVAAANWLLMLAAMMAPVLGDAIEFVRGHGLARRRSRSTLLFLGGYAAIWTVAGAAMRALAMTTDAVALTSVGAAAILILVLGWQCSPLKQACLNRCHARPELAAFGPRADVDAFRYGAVHGFWCIGSCWVWMFLPLLLPGGHLAAMAAATFVIFCERLDRPARPAWRIRGFGAASRIVAARLQFSSARLLASR